MNKNTEDLLKYAAMNPDDPVSKRVFSQLTLAGTISTHFVMIEFLLSTLKQKDRAQRREALSDCRAELTLAEAEFQQAVNNNKLLEEEICNGKDLISAMKSRLKPKWYQFWS